MRHFNYYLFDSYDPSEVRSPADDPRAVLNESADPVLSAVAEAEPGTVPYVPSPQTDNLIRIGLLRREGDAILLDSTVILREDASFLQTCFADSAARMADAILARKQEFYELAQKLANGFSPQVNLYHLLCGAILDGDFFDFLSRKHVVTTSRLHASGLDYLIIAYEKCEELDGFSRKLLCSYNRYTDGVRALQSFGDADGNRMDAFRFAAQTRLGKVPAHLKHLEALWAGTDKTGLLDAVQRFAETDGCDPKHQNLLTAFGYIRDGALAVPVYRKKDGPILDALESLTEACIFEEMKAALSAEGFSDLICKKHGVAAGEIANELYHVVFGQINEKLVEAGFVAAPPYLEGEGRYLQSIELE